MKIKIETAVKSKKGLIVFPLFQGNLKKLPKNCSEKVKKFVPNTSAFLVRLEIHLGADVVGTFFC